MARMTGYARPPLLLVAVTVALGVTAADLLVRLAGEIAAGRVGLDFAYDLAAARLGLQHGWAAVYDRHAYGLVTNHGGPLSYANTPVVAMLAVPFTALPFRLGMALWTLPLLAALVAAMMAGGARRPLAGSRPADPCRLAGPRQRPAQVAVMSSRIAA